VEDCGWDHFDCGWVGPCGITFPGEFSAVTMMIAFPRLSLDKLPLKACLEFMKDRWLEH
jgi:hypothetical protein